MTKSIDAASLRALLLGGEEHALIDVREQGMFGEDHILLAANIPVSRLELDFRDLVPRPTTRIVLCDGGDGAATGPAADWMAGVGYTDVAVLEGGVVGWADAGYEIFSGINVPSKLFGEYVEHHFETPSIPAEDLQARLDADEDLVILDTRPYDEYHRMNIPGGIDAPGVELAYRVRDMAPDPSTLVVVNCAGRTRSIIGCQSLVNAGVANKVVALRNGTMGWHLAGFEVEHGARRQCGPVSDDALAWSGRAAGRVAEKFGVRSITKDELAVWRDESDGRTLYLLDVRYPDEFESGHLAGSRSAPGGQLVQATDEYVATRNARLVLIDDTGIRATMAASWLLQMGWTDVVVLEQALTGETLESGAHQPGVPELDGVAGVSITPEAVRDLIAGEGAVVIDFGSSVEYRRRHIPGAYWAMRTGLAEIAEKLPPASIYVVTAPEDSYARLAARDLAAIVGKTVKWMSGGITAWEAAGFEAEDGTSRVLVEAVDRFQLPYDRSGGVESAMNRYLEWEVNLIEQTERDGTLKFPHFPA